MSKTDYYAKLHDLLVSPDTAGIVTVDDRRWITDRYVLLDADRCGVGVVVNGLDDGWYAVRRSGPPRRTGIWGLDDEGDPRQFAESIAKLKASFHERWSEWVELTPTPWAFTTTGKDGVHHGRILLDPEGRATCINSTLLGRWSWHIRHDPRHPARELRLEQAKGEHNRVIRVMISSRSTSATYEYMVDWSIAAWIMPVGRPELPDVVTLPKVVGDDGMD